MGTGGPEERSLSGQPRQRPRAGSRRAELVACCERHRLGLVYLFGSMAAEGAAFLDGTDTRARRACRPRRSSKKATPSFRPRP